MNAYDYPALKGAKDNPVMGFCPWYRYVSSKRLLPRPMPQCLRRWHRCRERRMRLTRPASKSCWSGCDTTRPGPSRKVEFKIRRRRYISQDVYARWHRLQKEAKPRLGDFAKDGTGQTLTHEHDRQRKGWSATIDTLSDAAKRGESHRTAALSA